MIFTLRWLNSREIKQWGCWYEPYEKIIPCKVANLYLTAEHLLICSCVCLLLFIIFNTSPVIYISRKDNNKNPCSYFAIDPHLPDLGKVSCGHKSIYSSKAFIPGRADVTSSESSPLVNIFIKFLKLGT